ncbi:MAG TPA: isoprenylcysteine carboxylmethyltransferase family protein [Candidatus Limnocylindria bacterium]
MIHPREHRVFYGAFDPGDRRAIGGEGRGRLTQICLASRQTGPWGAGKVKEMNLKTLVGSGDKIGLFTLPFVLVGVILNIVYPALFAVGGPPVWLWWLSIGVLVLGLAVWAWSVILILADVPRGRLITRGPYAWVRHPLYTAVALLVLPWLGFLLNTWLGAVIGAALYVASRRFAPAEEAELSRTFGEAWQTYSRGVKLHWL